jgi:hypothetical protein
MKRLIKVLAVAALAALILVTSVSPAVARAVRGGVLMKTTTPCEASSVARNGSGAHLRIDPPDRTPGCWVVLPPQSAA